MMQTCTNLTYAQTHIQDDSASGSTTPYMLRQTLHSWDMMQAEEPHLITCGRHARCNYQPCRTSPCTKVQEVFNCCEQQSSRVWICQPLR